MRSRKNKNIDKKIFNQKEIRKNPFLTPKNYFSKLSVNILKAVGVISIFSIFRTKIITIALISASIVGVSVSSYLYFNKPKKNSPNTAELKTSKNNYYEKLLAETYEITNDNTSNLTEYIKDVENLNIKIVKNNIIKENTDKNLKNNNYAFYNMPSEICSESAIILDATYPSSNAKYQWNNGAKTPQINISKSGLYVISTTLENGEILSKTISVKIIPAPIKSIANIINACVGSPVKLSATQTNKEFTYNWIGQNNNNSQIMVNKSGNYYVEIKGCKTYIDTFKVTFTHCDLGIPTEIATNSNGFNENFIIYNLNLYPNTALEIFDTKNQLVFKSLNYNNDWDISNVKSGDYRYILKFSDGIIEEGSFVLKR